MKYKIIDGTTIMLAGVASYDTVERQKKAANGKGVKINLDFDFPPTSQIVDIDTIKEEAQRIKEQAKKVKDEVKDKYKQYEKSQTHNSDTNANQAQEEEKDANSNNSQNNDDIFTTLGDTMRSLSKNIESWGKSFEKGFEKSVENWNENWNENWSENFEKGMSEFEKKMGNFGETMGKFGEEFERKFTEYAKNLNEHWNNEFKSEEYSQWQLESLFNELYTNNPEMDTLDRSPELFYEVEGYDLKTAMNDQLTFIGCHINTCEGVPFSFVTQQLVSDKWLVLKLSKDEYSKDWMKKLDTIEQLKDYDLEQFFIVRHFKDSQKQDDKKIKLYVPLKNK